MKRLIVALCSVALVAAGAVACTSSPETARTVDAPLQVTTTAGRLQGLTTATARQFLGVRYAQPPVADLRWKNPEPVVSAAGVVDATKAGAPCPQAGDVPGASATASKTEDCLFVNVTTPKTLTEGEKLPVMVWWHGGGYTSGAGSAYDAQRLASEGDVVVVTVNYRLGVFGYLGLPGLDGGGDFGLADQIAATRWAKDNAAAFGGDPGNITVFGQSAGAFSACALLTSPAAEGLVDKIAMASGNCGIRWPAGGLLYGTPAQGPYLSKAASERLGTGAAAQLGCTGGDVLGCMKQQSIDALLKVDVLFSNALAYDTDLLPKEPVQAVRAGDIAKIPVISGGNSHEESAFVGGIEQAMPGTYSAAAYPALVAAAYPQAAAQVLAQYPATGGVTPAAAFADLITDSSWRCPTLATDADIAAHGGPVFSYEFGPSETPNVNGVTIPTVPQAAAHADDVPYLFDLTGKNLLTTAAEKSLATTMIAYWTSFARSGTPSAPGSPAWPRTTGADGPSLRFGDSIDTADLTTTHHCDFWQAVPGG